MSVFFFTDINSQAKSVFLCLFESRQFTGFLENQDRGSRIEDRGSGIEDRGSGIWDRGSGIGDRGSRKIKLINKLINKLIS